MRHKHKRDHHDMIGKVLGRQVEMQSILHNRAAETILPTNAAKSFTKLVNAFLKGYSLLANRADHDKVLLFALTPNFHYLYHLGQRDASLNPRKGNTMVDEGFVGQCKHLVSACAHGTEAAGVPERFF